MLTNNDLHNGGFPMYNNTILNSLNQYKVFIQCENALRTQSIIDSIIKKIDTLREYINQGGEINRLWLETNYEVVSKAIKHHHDFIHQNEGTSEEHRELNILLKFYTEFYKQNKIDLMYMSI